MRAEGEWGGQGDPPADLSKATLQATRGTARMQTQSPVCLRSIASEPDLSLLKLVKGMCSQPREQ